MTLQEGSGYVEHEILHERFHVTHFAGCAILFTEDTSYPNIDDKSIYLHDTRRVLHDHIVEGEHGRVLQGVVSRASFSSCGSRRSESLHCVIVTHQQYLCAASGQTVFTVYHYTSTMSTPRKEVLPRKSSRPFVLL